MALSPQRVPATLFLRGEETFRGYSFGAPVSVAGEVVFTTGMVGYPESLTDPSFHGQILVLTSPMVGNYGVPPLHEKDSYGLSKYFESQDGKIHAAAVVVSENCDDPDHWQKYSSLHEWLASQNVPGLMCVDTRSLVLRLREMGTALGKIVVNDVDVSYQDNNARNLVAEVSTKHRMSFGHGNLVILCLDMGVKLNTLRCLLRYDITLHVVPHDWDITQETYDGLFISNGPGNPQLCTATIRSVRWALQHGKPIFGICMGNQMLALAAGGNTFKMKYGHRGQNQPAAECARNGRVVITTQNHGFAVDMTSMPPEEWEETFVNANDGSNEGLRHKTKPFFSVQFHPEGRCGPQDTEYLFYDFIKSVERSKIEEIQRNRPRKVLVLGAGGITIAQAGEFDYSGSQCLKSLREEGIQTVLINPNIATVQTDSESADQIYFVPVTPDAVERVIEKERPDGILLGWGGQTALNCGLQLDRLGILKKYNVRVLGTQASTIAVTEDRELFRDALLQINEHVATSQPATTVEEAAQAAAQIGYPVMVRAAFCLGGQGSGIVHNEVELRDKCAAAFAIAPQVLIEMSVAGWKEVEYEVVRDIYDNCITVCNMENFDPMGIHTGESIVVAPSQTLTNDEYHMLRSASIRIIRHLGVVGECNIQYGLDPTSHRYVVIEVNARLSRSSALASKATGYPLAHVAAKLALGKGLSDITNGVTKSTTACFEPSLDYIVVKLPRWDLGKFNMVSEKIGSMMKSVGEVMAIGRNFEEAIQKALRMVDPSNIGFDVPSRLLADWNFEDAIKNPTPDRIWAICRAFELDWTEDRVHQLSKISKFFLTKLRGIVLMRKELKARYEGRLSELDSSLLLRLKSTGFSDKQLAKALDCTPEAVRARRLQLGVIPRVKQIDTVAGEFPAAATYLFTSYNAQQDDVKFGEPMYVVLGCGVYRIGNSVEFDYCGVLVCRELRRLGHKVIMINYNPETVSTDYDECDRLYFDELTEEVVLDILAKERVAGVIISVGGQIVQNMALKLKEAGLPILGTDPRFIDMAENRNKFSIMCDEIGVSQPSWVAATTLAEAHEFCRKVGYPCLVRPSYVLSGSAMSVISTQEDVDRFLTEAARVSGDYPVVISKYWENSIEYDVDVVAHFGKVLCYSISEHVEHAGVHSGDATMFLPPQNKDPDTMKALYDAACQIAERLNVCGPMNVQFLRTSTGHLKVIEANVRCSRSIPFVSKTLGISFPAVMVSAFLATKDNAMVPIKRAKMTHIGCKAAMFSFNRLAGADPILGVEMASTGEVGVFGRDKHEVLLKAMLCQNFRYPTRAVLISVESPAEATLFAPFARILSKKLSVLATPHAAAALAELGVPHTVVPMPPAAAPNAQSVIVNKEVDLVIEIRDKTKDFMLRRVTPETAPPGYWIRRSSIDYNVPLITEIEIARLFSEAFEKYTPADIEIEPFRTYVPKIFRKPERNKVSMLHRHKVALCIDEDVDSVVLALRMKHEGVDLKCFHFDIGQKLNEQSVVQQLRNQGLVVDVVDLRDEMAESCFTMVMMMAALETPQWEIGAISRDVVRRGAIDVARKNAVSVIAAASTRAAREAKFERYVKVFAPEILFYNPWCDPRLIEDFSTHEDKLAYISQHGVDLCPNHTPNNNLAGMMYAYNGSEPSQRKYVSALADAPDEPEFALLKFREGRCVEINNVEVTPLQAMRIANDIGQKHGVGFSVKRGGEKAIEAPGMQLIARALRFLLQETFDRTTLDVLRTYSIQIAEQVRLGRLAEPATKSMFVAVQYLAHEASGSVNLEIHKGEAIFLNASSEHPSNATVAAHEDVFAPGEGSFTDFQW